MFQMRSAHPDADHSAGGDRESLHSQRHTAPVRTAIQLGMNSFFSQLYQLESGGCNVAADIRGTRAALTAHLFSQGGILRDTTSGTILVYKLSSKNKNPIAPINHDLAAIELARHKVHTQNIWLPPVQSLPREDARPGRVHLCTRRPSVVHCKG